MPKYVKITAEGSTEELQIGYRKASDPVERSHWQILWLISQGHSPREVASMVGYSAGWIREVVRRYNQGGQTAIGDHRRSNAGADPLLSAHQQADLDHALEGPTPDGGLWSGPKVAQWMSSQLGRPVHPQRGWEYLRRLEFTPRRPRPRHAKADAEAQEAFKKTARSR